MKVCPKCGKQFADDANFCPVDAAKLQSASQVVPVITPESALEARFDRGERIGGGTSGEVYQAVDKQSGQAVVVKIVSPQVLASPQVVQRAERELKQLERVEHPAIARVIASGRQASQLWVATEQVGGARTLADVVASGGPLDPQRASDVVLVIGEALIEAAKLGVVHRDLAPKNVLVAGDEVKLINFAVPVPTSDKVPGVPEFVAPDLVEGKPVDQRSNIYSLGALYYFLLTGQPPFTGDAATVHQAHLSAPLVPPSQKAPVPADLDGVVARAMERNAAKRYLTVRQFLDDIQKLAQADEGVVRTTAPFGRAGKQAALAQTMLGVGPSAATEAKTRQVEVQVPAEAIGGSAGTVAGTIDSAPRAASPWQPPASVEAEVQPQMQVPMQPQMPVSGQVYAAAGGGGGGVGGGVPAGGGGAGGAGGHGSGGGSNGGLPPERPSGPIVGAGAAGKKKPAGAEDRKAQKGKFRETMWFKKGDLDAAAAEVAAEERAQGKDVDLDQADSLPIDERYKDDGSINQTDAQRYSLKTGSTQVMPAIRDQAGPAGSGHVSEDDLIGEMKGGRNKLIIAIVIAAVLLVIAVIALAT
jgi:tRNA A-37 threonylcarbamoyl transferase component Bud32